MLFYSIPRKDTNGIAHKLVSRFKTINGLLNATEDELREVEGVTENTVLHFKLITDLMRKYIKEMHRPKDGVFLRDEQIIEYILPNFIGLRREYFHVMALDKDKRIINESFISIGTNEEVVATTSRVRDFLAANKASYAVVSHNHPNGFALPSPQDIDGTRQMAEALSGIDVVLYDHIIAAPDGDGVSLRLSPQYEQLFNIKREVARTIKYAAYSKKYRMKGRKKRACI